MPNWLYNYFGDVVKPLITMNEKQQLSMQPSFADNGILSPSFYLFMWAIALLGMYESTLLLPKQYIIDKLVLDFDVLMCIVL